MIVRLRSRRGLLWGLTTALFLVAFATLGRVAYVTGDAAAYQRAARAGLAAGSPVVAIAMPAPRAEGDLVGELRLPRLALRVMVVHGESDRILARAVGHLAGTAWPGEAGNVVLAGHRDTFFRPLRHVEIGDIITLATPGGALTYIVESTTVVDPTDLDALASTGGRTLTLITCFPFTYVGPAPARFIVRARQTD